MNSESMGTLPCHANIIQRKVKILSKAAARPLRFSEARIMLFLRALLVVEAMPHHNERSSQAAKQLASVASTMAMREIPHCCQ